MIDFRVVHALRDVNHNIRHPHQNVIFIADTFPDIFVFIFDYIQRIFFAVLAKINRIFHIGRILERRHNSKRKRSGFRRNAKQFAVGFDLLRQILVAVGLFDVVPHGEAIGQASFCHFKTDALAVLIIQIPVCHNHTAESYIFDRIKAVIVIIFIRRVRFFAGQSFRGDFRLSQNARELDSGFAAVTGGNNQNVVNFVRLHFALRVSLGIEPDFRHVRKLNIRIKIIRVTIPTGRGVRYDIVKGGQRIGGRSFADSPVIVHIEIGVFAFLE